MNFFPEPYTRDKKKKKRKLGDVGKHEVVKKT